jgi:hypothetical protein
MRVVAPVAADGALCRRSALEKSAIGISAAQAE